MSAKNKVSVSQTPLPNGVSWKPHTLRLRIVLWYGMLLTFALVFFAILVWILTTNTLTQGVDSALHAELRVAGVALEEELHATPPYWPANLSLPASRTSQEQGVQVIVIDLQGVVRYPADTASVSPTVRDIRLLQTTRLGHTALSTLSVQGGGRIRIEAIPLRTPSALSSNKTPNEILGTLIVAKSLDDLENTLLLLRTLLLFAGLVVLIGTFVGGWVIAANVLRPLAELMKTSRAIADTTIHGTRLGNLSQRVPRPRGHDEIVQVVDTFNEMLASLENATQVQQRFIADASHELRAPLTTVQGNLAFLQRHLDELPPDERRAMLTDAYGETLRLAQLVDALLLLARADASVDIVNKGETTLQQQPLELDRVVLHLTRQLRVRLSSENVQTKLEIGHIEPLRVRGDEEYVRRILLILLDNALKYTSGTDKEKTGRVVISLERNEHEALIVVSDNGIGIDAFDLPHIFERFYRADRARSRAGTGLGLAIAYMLVEQLHGRITAESTSGQGSTFYVWLPLA